jgi:hypothetical protein
LGFETGIAVKSCRKPRGLTCHFETEAGQPAEFARRLHDLRCTRIGLALCVMAWSVHGLCETGPLPPMQMEPPPPPPPQLYFVNVSAWLSGPH